MKYGAGLWLSGVGTMVAAAAAAQQTADPATNEEPENETIVVSGQLPRGMVEGDFSSESQLDAGDVRGLGVTSVGELLQVLGPELSSARGRGGEPAFLIDGQRTSGRHEVWAIPSEAIVRVDILPEEAGLRYGFDAGQRVVNFVLRRWFHALTVEGRHGGATEGGRPLQEAKLGDFAVRDGGRLTIDATYRRAGELTENERDVRRDAPLLPDAGRYRSLLPKEQGTTLTAAWLKPIGEHVTLTLTGRADWSEQQRGLGVERDAIASAPTAGRRETDAVDVSLVALLDRRNRIWPWSLTTRFERTNEEARRDIDNIDTDTTTRAEDKDSIRIRAETEFVTTGAPLGLPAGEAALTLATMVRIDAFESKTTAAGGTLRADADRQQASARFSFALPIASARDGVLAALGSLSLNANAAMTRLSDAGTVRTIGGGISWKPDNAVDVIASITREDGAPDIRQLGLSQSLTPGVRVFDYTLGETVFVDRLDGGNQGLGNDRRRVVKLGVTVRPIDGTRLSVTANYLDERTRNPVGSLPAPTAALEAAFPDRFRRNASGKLNFIDTTPVNFAAASSRQLRFSLNWSEALERKRPPDAAGAVGRPPQDGREAGQQAGARGFGRGGFGGGGRVQLSLVHTWRLTDRLRLAEGLTALDLLSGDTVDDNGGRPQHELDGRLSIAWMGFGGRISTRWRQGTRVEGGAVDDLRFGALATVDLRLFATLDGQRTLVRRHPELGGWRLGVDISNLFNARQQVTTADGATPEHYQPALLDPLGRAISISLRKQL